MTLISRKAKEILPAHLGRCPKCMRQSFIVMLFASALTLVIAVTANSPILRIAGGIGAGGSVLLWLSHLAAFSVRAVTAGKTSSQGALNRQRREFILGFSRNFILIAAATAMPLRSAFAQSRISDCLACCATQLNSCGSGGDCNTLYQNCVSNCNTQGESPSSWKCW